MESVLDPLLMPSRALLLPRNSEELILNSLLAGGLDQRTAVPKNLQELINRAVRDPEFRRQFLTDPEKTIQAEGYDIDPAAWAQIMKVREVPPEAIDTIIEIEHLNELRAG
jgi:hypothetical protein